MIVQNRFVVSIQVTVTDVDGRILDTFPEEEPLEYLHGGYGDIFPLVEAALEGKEVGDTVMLTLEAKDAFGEYDPKFIQTFSKIEILGVDQAVGETIMLEDEDGDVVSHVITGVGKDGSVTVDLNHPLSGKTVVYTAEILDIRPATEEELLYETAESASDEDDFEDDEERE